MTILIFSKKKNCIRVASLLAKLVDVVSTSTKLYDVAADVAIGV